LPTNKNSYCALSDIGINNYLELFLAKDTIKKD
jgi:hypothetical protein